MLARIISCVFLIFSFTFVVNVYAKEKSFDEVCVSNHTTFDQEIISNLDGSSILLANIIEAFFSDLSLAVHQSRCDRCLKR